MRAGLSDGVSVHAEYLRVGVQSFKLILNELSPGADIAEQTAAVRAAAVGRTGVAAVVADKAAL